MRKNFLFFLGAAAGACLTLLVTGPQGAQWAQAARAAAGPEHLFAAQSVWRGVRADQDRLRREARRRQADRGRDQRHGHVARSAFALHEREGLARHAGDDPWRVRRARHRGHDGERPGQGGFADGRHARGEGRHPVGRPDHPDRRRSGSGADPGAGRQQDEGADQYQDPAQDHRARAWISRSTFRSRARSSACARSPTTRRRRHRLYPDRLIQRADDRRI